MIAVAYIRVSSTKQLDGDGPDRQVERISAYATEHDFDVGIARTFVEDISGTKDSTKRPVFSAMLEFCEQHAISHILIEKMDRWARDLIVGELLLAQCRKLQITVIDCSTGLNLTEESDDPYATFVRQVMLAAAELNKNVFVHQTKKARRRIRQRSGKCEGRKGYADTPGWEHVVESARRHRSAGRSYAFIAESLNLQGLPTMSGKPWTKGTVHQMLNSVALNS